MWWWWWWWGTENLNFGIGPGWVGVEIVPRLDFARVPWGCSVPLQAGFSWLGWVGGGVREPLRITAENLLLIKAGPRGRSLGAQLGGVSGREDVAVLLFGGARMRPGQGRFCAVRRPCPLGASPHATLACKICRRPTARVPGPGSPWTRQDRAAGPGLGLWTHGSSGWSASPPRGMTPLGRTTIQEARKQSKGKSTRNPQKTNSKPTQITTTPPTGDTAVTPLTVRYSPLPHVGPCGIALACFLEVQFGPRPTCSERKATRRATRSK